MKKVLIAMTVLSALSLGGCTSTAYNMNIKEIENCRELTKGHINDSKGNIETIKNQIKLWNEQKSNDVKILTQSGLENSPKAIELFNTWDKLIGMAERMERQLLKYHLDAIKLDKYTERIVELKKELNKELNKEIELNNN